MRARTTFKLALAASTFLTAGFARAADMPASAAGKPSASQSSTTQISPPDTVHRHGREKRPAIFLAWGAPWGTPGARENATSACDDTLAADSLFLTYDPGEDYEALLGIDATLVFHSAPGDTLGSFWDLSRKGANPYNLRIQYEPPPEGTANAWPLTGAGNVRYAKKGDRGQLDLTYFVQASKAGPIYAGERYFLARVVLRLRRASLEGCRQPVCVDFDHLMISHREGGRWINTGERFTSWNSPGGKVCTEYRKRPPSEEPVRFGGLYDSEAPGRVPSAPPDTTRR